MSKQTDFDELHMALKEEAHTIIDKPTDKSKKDKISNKCPHENTLLDHGLKVMVCTECFIAIVDDSGSFTGASSSFARCFARKVSDKGIYNDVIGYGFPNNIIFEANRIYSHVTKGKTCRANNRQGLVFACVFHAFQNSGEPKSFDYINKKFNLQQKVISKGVKRVGLSMAGLNIKNTYITKFLSSLRPTAAIRIFIRVSNEQSVNTARGETNDGLTPSLNMTDIILE